MAYRHGFKAEAERLALDIRQELGLSPYARLDPLMLAEHLAISVTSLSDLASGRGDPDLSAAVGYATPAPRPGSARFART
jgi:hypothetical protein